MENDVVVHCGWCGEEMEQGYLASMNVHYIPAGELTPLANTKKQMEKHNCIPLIPTPGLSNLGKCSVIAYVCRTCKKIVVPY